jgi:2-isopropylmalate synthase
MTTQEKLTMAHALEDLGVDIVEAGFAMASEGDFAAIATITQAIHKPRIASLARAKKEDIEMAARALQFADRARIHVFLASSDLHLEYKLKISRAEALDLTGESVRLARSLVDDVEFSPEDATRSERNFLVEMVRIAIEAGATTINMPDTVGYTTPEEYGQMFREVRERVPAIDAQGIILSSHCHDDLGLAVANSLAAIQNGARQVECTVNGIGERAGNAALEEIAAALCARRPLRRKNRPQSESALPGQPGAGPAHHLSALAEQGDCGRQRIRARVRHSPARHAGQPALLRDHDADAGGRGAQPPGAGQALRARGAAQPLRAVGIHPDPR